MLRSRAGTQSFEFSLPLISVSEAQRELNEIATRPAQFPAPADTRRQSIPPFSPKPQPSASFLFQCNRAELFAKEHRPSRSWAGSGCGRHGPGRSRPGPGLSNASCQLGFWDPGLGKALRRPGPKLSSRWPSVLGARSPSSNPACPLRSLEHLPNSTPSAFLKLKPVWSVRRSCSFKKIKPGQPDHREERALSWRAKPSLPAQPGAPLETVGLGDPSKLLHPEEPPEGPLGGSDTDERPSFVPFSSAPALPRGFDKRPLRFCPVSLTM